MSFGPLNCLIVIVSPSNAVTTPACSAPSLTPSASLSAFSGLLAEVTSSPSLSPSRSLSALRGLVPSLNSLRFLRPSRSASFAFQAPFSLCFAAQAAGLGFLAAEADAGTISAASARMLRKRTRLRMW